MKLLKQWAQTTKEFIGEIKKVTDRANRHHVGAYAAQSAFFFVLSLIPLMLLLLTIIQFTPITKADVMTAMIKVVPEVHMQSFIMDIVNEVYNISRTFIPISAVMAIWSASKAVLAITNGLNSVYKCRETRNYILMRIYASLYTVVFVVAIVAMMVFAMFGGYIAEFISRQFPFWSYWVQFVLESRLEIGFMLIWMFTCSVYAYIPNKKRRIRKQWIGATFTAFACMLISYIFSMYLMIFQGFTGLYGSMTAIILVMLWLYFCMYAILIGGMFNQMLEEKRLSMTEEEKKMNWFLS